MHNEIDGFNIDPIGRAVLREVAECPGTSDEIAQRLDMPVTSVRPRMSELKAWGLVVATDTRRETATGRTAAVMRYRYDPAWRFVDEAETPVMRQARQAAVTVAAWSPSKREYAQRVVNGAA